jgi:protein-S-isoprenylcysteine O-methyltransferase Ste14
MSELLAFITVTAWPLIPLLWIPVHLFPPFFRKIQFFTYLLPLCVWLPLAYVLYQNKALLLQAKVEFPLIIRGAGFLLLAGGTLLHFWTGKLLTFRGIIGLPEISGMVKGEFVRKGAFSFVRHPTYLAHTIMFSGVFFISGVTAAGIITLLDFAVVHLLIIPLEEKELLVRFGNAYRQYIYDVPRFFPGPGRKRQT